MKALQEIRDELKIISEISISGGCSICKSNREVLTNAIVSCIMKSDEEIKECVCITGAR